MRKLTAFLLIFVLLAGCTPAGPTGDDLSSPSVSPVETSTPDPTPTPTLEPTPTPPPEPITATLTIAGDAMCHAPYNHYVEATGEYDFTPVFRYAKPWVEAADLAVVNLETTLSGPGADPANPDYTGYPMFNTPDSYAYALKDAGFDLFCTTNNHSLDRYFRGLSRTLDVLDEAGIPHVGTYRTEEERNKNNGIVVMDCGGISIAFLAYTYGTNGIPVPSDSPWAINIFNIDYLTYLSEFDTELVAADMAAARALGCDLIAVIMHWGNEYHLEQNGFQERHARTLIDLGADLVLGGHPHVLEPYEFVTTEAGNSGFVCYSLGNFVSGQTYEYTDTTVLLNLNLKKDLVTGETTVEGVSYVPFLMLYNKYHEGGIVLLDVYSAMAEYESGENDLITSDVYARLEKALSVCHTVLGAEGDSQAQAPEA